MILFESSAEWGSDDPPYPAQLSKMIFGASIHPDLLSYLLKFKPVRSMDYFNDAGILMGSCRGSVCCTRFNSGVSDFYEKMRMTAFYDPFLLFDTPEQFYCLLNYHPQATQSNFGAVTYRSGQAGDDIMNEEDAEDDGSGAPRPQPSSFLSKLKSGFHQPPILGARLHRPSQLTTSRCKIDRQEHICMPMDASLSLRSSVVNLICATTSRLSLLL